MKKKTCLIIIGGVTLLIGSVIGCNGIKYRNNEICYVQDEKTNNTELEVNSELEESKVKEDEILEKDADINTEIEVASTETKNEEIQPIENTPKDTIKQSSNTKSTATTIKEDKTIKNTEEKANTETSASKNVNINTESKSLKQETPTKEIEKTSTVTKQDEQQTVSMNKCNHERDVGNSKKWFDTQVSAIAYYDSLTAYWSNKWENNEIDDKTYYKNCPART